MKKLKVLLILIAVICIGVAASYPIRYKIELDSNNSELEDLSSMRRRVMEEQHLDPAAEDAAAVEAATVETEAPVEPQMPIEAEASVVPEAPLESDAPEKSEAAHPSEMPEAEPAAAVTEAVARESTSPQSSADTRSPEDTLAPSDTYAPEDTQAPSETVILTDTQAPVETGIPVATRTPDIMDFIIDEACISTATPRPTSTPTPTPSPTPSPTPDRSIRDDADTFKDKAKIRLDEDKILPELREIYELNHDLVGWLYIEDTNIDYPVVQSEDGKFYLTHDFYGRSNANGQIILEDKCDPYTPSYNLVLSGHHMNSGAMFGRLGKYKDKEYWETHKVVEFDTLMARKRYVIFGAFYSADYDEHEEGFRYSADIQYNIDAEMWLDEIRANQIYETGIDAEFGDEFITLTTCDHSRRYDGRFVVVARRIREGEKFQ